MTTIRNILDAGSIPAVSTIYMEKHVTIYTSTIYHYDVNIIYVPYVLLTNNLIDEVYMFDLSNIIIAVSIAYLMYRVHKKKELAEQKIKEKNKQEEEELYNVYGGD